MAAGRLLAAGLLVLSSGTVEAQTSVRPDGVQVGAEARGLWTRFNSGDQSRWLGFREGLGLGLAGSVLSPKFLFFDGEIRPTWVQYRIDSPGLPEDRLADLDLLYRISAHALDARRVSLTGQAYRSVSTIPGGYGQATEYRDQAWGATLLLRYPALPAELYYSDQGLQQLTTVPGKPGGAQLDYGVRRIGALATNSKLRLDISRLYYDNRTAPAFNYSLDQALLMHRGSWGKGSRLGTRLTHTDQHRSGPYRQQVWEEELHLQHTREVYTEWSSHLSRIAAGGMTTTGNRFRGDLTVMPVPALALGFGGQSSQSRLLTGVSRYASVGARAAWSGRLPAKASLRVSGSVNREYLDQDPSFAGEIPVVNERHQVTSSRRFLLDNPNQVPGSLVISDVSETLVYQEGFDYQSFVSVGTTEVVVLPTGRIAVGDTVLADYRFTVFPSGSDRAWLTQTDAAFGWRALEFYYKGFTRNGAGEGAGGQAPGVGRALDISDLYDHTVGVRSGATLGSLSYQLSAERRERTWTGNAFRGTALRGSLSWQAGPRVRLTGGADWSSGGDNLSTRVSETGDLTLEWQAVTRRAASLVVRATGRGWYWKETPGNRQALLGSALEGDLSVNRLRVRARWEFNEWEWSPADREQRFYFWLTRRIR